MFLYYNGQWGKICDDSWDILDAHVLCRMLGYIRAVGLASFGGANSGPMWLDDLNCTGTEHTLAACVHGGWRISDCNHGKDAGVICDTNHTVRAKGEIKSIVNQAKYTDFEIGLVFPQGMLSFVVFWLK